MKLVFSPEQIEDMLERRKKGESFETIAHIYSCSRSVIQKRCRANGDATNFKKRKQAIPKGEWKELINSDMTNEDIASQYGITVDRVRARRRAWDRKRKEREFHRRNTKGPKGTRYCRVCGKKLTAGRYFYCLEHMPKEEEPPLNQDWLRYML